jgi:serine/threonine protein kinase
MSEAPAFARGTTFGKYQLIERLGRGGMAEVWKARLVGAGGFQRTLVVKRILPHLAEDEVFVKMFVAEARLSARLNHANIVQVFELGDVDGEYFLAMEYVRGRDVVGLMRAQILRGAPDLGLAAYIGRETARALGYAHSLCDDEGHPLRLIHRDVSPSNVMLAVDGAVKLLDFGVAKALAEAGELRTQTGTLKGKFGYMAPEQVDGKPIDNRADLFAAGVVLHEMLTGRRLFKGEHDLATIAMVREAKVDPPSVFNKTVPPEMDAIVLKALARQPDDRYASGEALAEALDGVVHQLKWGPERARQFVRDLFPGEPSGTKAEPVEVLPVTTGARKRRAAASKRKSFVQVGGAIVAAAAVAGVGVWFFLRSPSPPPKPVAPPVLAVAPAPSPAPVAPPEQPKPVAAPEKPAPPPKIQLSVQTTPSAEVLIDGKSRGKTPITLELPHDINNHSVELRARGYRPLIRSTPFDRDISLDLSLVAATPVSSGKHAVVKRPTTTPSTGDKPAPNLKAGDVVDPFANK